MFGVLMYCINRVNWKKKYIADMKFSFLSNIFVCEKYETFY